MGKWEGNHICLLKGFFRKYVILIHFLIFVLFCCCLKENVLYCTDNIRWVLLVSSQVHIHFGANCSGEQVWNLTLYLDPWRRHCFSRCTVHVSSGVSVRRWWPYSSWCLSNSRQMAGTSLTTPRWRLKSQGQTKSFQSGSQWDVLCHWALVSKKP